MRTIECNIIILQYLENRTNRLSGAAERFMPRREGDPDPVGVILDYADAHTGMAVFLGLRRDATLEGSSFLNQPVRLRKRLKDELAKSIALARQITARYRLNERRSFAGWYLPTEVANFEEKHRNNNGWVSQLNQFYKALVPECRKLVNKPVAVSPYFNGNPAAHLLSAKRFGENYARLLKDTGISIVMLQDGVGAVARPVPTDQIEAWVQPFRDAIEQACRLSSPPGEPIEFWLNVECVGADIRRLQKQMEMAKGHARKLVTFDFPHHLNQAPLYDDYLQLISNNHTNYH